MRVSVHDLLRDGRRVTGVTTSAVERRARLVIGADCLSRALAAMSWSLVMIGQTINYWSRAAPDRQSLLVSRGASCLTV